MRNRLIKWLGGFTSDELARITEAEWLRSQLEAERHRYQNLEQIILKRYGIITPDAPQVQMGEQRPVPTSSEPWSKRRKRLEDADLKQHLDNLEQEYKRKPGTVAMPPGNSIGADNPEHVS